MCLGFEYQHRPSSSSAKMLKIHGEHSVCWEMDPRVRGDDEEGLLCRPSCRGGTPTMEKRHPSMPSAPTTTSAAPPSPPRHPQRKLGIHGKHSFYWERIPAFAGMTKGACFAGRRAGAALPQWKRGASMPCPSIESLLGGSCASQRREPGGSPADIKPVPGYPCAPAPAHPHSPTHQRWIRWADRRSVRLPGRRS